MKQLTHEEFIQYFHKYNRFPYNTSIPKRINKAVLDRKYRAYVRSIEKANIRHKKQVKKANKANKPYKIKPISESEKKAKIQDKKVKAVCIARANNKCELTPILTPNERLQAESRLFPQLEVLDPAHIIGRANKKLRWDKDNIVIMKRGYHTLIDQGLSPITGKPISKEEKNQLWIRIIGVERWNYLMRMKNE